MMMLSLRRFVFPILLLIAAPPFVIFMWYTAVFLEGSLLNLISFIYQKGAVNAIVDVWGPVFLGSKTAWMMIGVFAIFQILLIKFLPGPTYYGPFTPKGNRPVYKANGIAAFLITVLSFYLATDFFQLFPATLIYDHFGHLLGALNLFGLGLCLFLFVKGHLKPSSSDYGISKNPLFDFFWGIELFPRILGWDVKQFTNCRFGMMSWSLILLSFAAKQQQLYGLSDALVVAVTLQMVYIAKFFFWETGYMRSMDIIYDRAGFMICWGCLVWVPGIYTLSTLYLVNHPQNLGGLASGILMACGISAIALNYWADRQRQVIRSGRKEVLIWKKKPALISASYKTHDGNTHETVLLASGFWGMARHFHYLPEILAALFWTLPALFEDSLPYFYVVFLSLLLIDRLHRHERRCALKYGDGWRAYCSKVPYLLIPKVY